MTHSIAFPSGPVKVEGVREHTHMGVKFVTHQVPTQLNDFQKFRASEWRTGYGIPNTWGETHDEALKKTHSEIERIGIEKFSKAVSKLPTLNHIAEDTMGGIA